MNLEMPTNHKELGIGLINIKKYLKFCEQNNIYSVIEVKRKQELINSIDYIRKEKWILWVVKRNFLWY